MRYRAFFSIGLLLFFLVFVSGCTGSSRNQFTPIKAVNGTPVNFTISDNGKGYSIPKNTEFTVTLIETRADRSIWRASASPGLTVLGDQYHPNPAAIRVDINGFHVWKIRAVENGLQTFSADYYQSGDTVQNHFTLYLQVLRESDS